MEYIITFIVSYHFYSDLKMIILIIMRKEYELHILKMFI